MRPRGIVLLLLGAASVSAAVATPAQAQTPVATFPLQEYSAVTYRPMASRYDYLMVEGARLEDFQYFPARLVFDFAVDPLEMSTDCASRPDLNCGINPDEVQLVDSLTVLHLSAGFTLAERVELGLSIPFLYAYGQGLEYRGSTQRAGSSGGLGDPRISGKLWLLGNAQAGYAISTTLFLTLPLGQATAERRYVGDEHPQFGGHVIGELFPTERLRVALNLGAYYRAKRQTLDTEVGSMVYYGIAGEYLFTPPASLFGVSGIAELTGSTLFGGRPDLLEGRVAGRVRWEALYGDLGFGLGFVAGPGVPDFRFLLSVGVALDREIDTDGDGLLDSEDACVDRPEDMDGFADDDGCPEHDNDGDGLGDSADRCPDTSEDFDGNEDEDGCPENDNDGDGVDDGWDSCPDTPEDLDGDRDDDGCPENDADGDGIDDEYDECPNRPEDLDGLGDEDGCPETNFDNDNIRDERDQCPEDPEDRDWYQDRDGCPEPGGRINASPVIRDRRAAEAAAAEAED